MDKVKVTITRRIDPCSCGCQGKDPQHARKFDRVVSNVTDETGTCRVTAYREPVMYRRTGTAKFPWTDEAVKVVEVMREFGDKKLPLGWFICAD